MHELLRSALIAASSLGLAGYAEAGGLFLTEMATPDMGSAAAGRAALATDAATAFGNPAGMTRLDDSQMLAGVQAAYGVARFDRGDNTTSSGGNGGNASGFAPGLGAYGVYSATPDLKLGISLGSNFGGDLQYQSNWSGRYYSQQSELITIGAFPVAAYRINKWLSVGGGAQIIYGRLNEKTAINDPYGGGDGSIDVGATDIGYGGMAGILLEPVEGTRFGVTYNSQVKLDFKDKPKTNNLSPDLKADLHASGLTGAKIDLGLTIPNQVLISGYHDLTDTLAIVGNVVWQQWSEFGRPSLEVTSTTRNRATADLDYDDTWGFAIGARYKFQPDWIGMVGAAYDTSPQSKSNRSPALPMDRQIRVGAGAQYVLNERFTFGAAYEYLNLGDCDIDRSKQLAGTLEGKYSTNEVHFFNITTSLRF